MGIKYVFVALSLFALVLVSRGDDTLLSVVQVFRHGERTPLLFYPTDPYTNKSYWNGLNTGQLTENGKKQLIQLGQYFRERYGDFLSDEYSSEEIYVSTVKTERNVLSAQSFLVGLYPDDDTSSVPLHVSPVAVMGDLAECLKYDALFAEVELEDEYFKKVNVEHADTYTYVREHSVFPVFGLLTAHSIWDTLNIEHGVNYTLPEWTESVFPEELTNLTDIFALALCYTEEQQQLISGPFINELIQYFEKVLAATPTPKVRLYSGHDVNIACFLNTFEAFTPHMPDFASSLIFELRQKDGTNYINAYYKQHEEAVPITLRGCDFNCNFDDFKSVFRSIVITETEWVVKCFIP